MYTNNNGTKQNNNKIKRKEKINRKIIQEISSNFGVIYLDK